MNKIVELFGLSTSAEADWRSVVAEQRCPFLERACLKVRKSDPETAIGTCTLMYGERPVIICPHRMLQRRQVFSDCVHLLTRHEPGNELHIIREVEIPGGSIDYFLASVRDRRVIDFAGIELQTLDTTGTTWPERQRLLAGKGLRVARKDVKSAKSFGMNWKMTAKTVLVQLHHKVQTFEHINRHLVLVVQDRLLEYMREEFCFGHLRNAALGDAMQLHVYELISGARAPRLFLVSRLSTDAAGVARCLGLQADSNVELLTIVRLLESKLSDETILTLQ